MSRVFAKPDLKLSMSYHKRPAEDPTYRVCDTESIDEAEAKTLIITHILTKYRNGIYHNGYISNQTNYIQTETNTKYNRPIHYLIPSPHTQFLSCRPYVSWFFFLFSFSKIEPQKIRLIRGLATFTYKNMIWTELSEINIIWFDWFEIYTFMYRMTTYSKLIIKQQI